MLLLILERLHIIIALIRNNGWLIWIIGTKTFIAVIKSI